jgi:hypothetical protein
MSHNNELESWARGIIAKRTPDALKVLSCLLEAGLRKGECSAADIPEALYFAEVNIIGATFRILPMCGFYKDRTRWVKLKVKRKHGREVPVWVLDKRWKAEALLGQFRRALVAQPGKQEQMALI